MQRGVEAEAALTRPGQQRPTGWRTQLLELVTRAQAHILPIRQLTHRIEIGSRSREAEAEVRRQRIPISLKWGRGTRCESGEQDEQPLHQGHGRKAISDGVVKGEQ